MLLGVGLAMDAFSVSLANGLADREMKFSKVSVIAGTFAVFQFAMPMIGWVLVHTAVEYLEWFEKLVPWIALILLAFIGGKMIKDGLEERKSRSEDADAAEAAEEIGIGMLMTQGVATSIDALSVGFTTAHYGAGEALLYAAIIGIVTFLICVAGCLIGRKAGTMLSWKAAVLGGLILIAIGLRIWIGGAAYEVFAEGSGIPLDQGIAINILDNSDEYKRREDYSNIYAESLAQSIKEEDGEFVLGPGARLYCADDAEEDVRNTLVLMRVLMNINGLSSKDGPEIAYGSAEDAKAGDIRAELVSEDEIAELLGDVKTAHISQSYVLDIKKDSVYVKASSSDGLYYGLLSLMEIGIEKKKAPKADANNPEKTEGGETDAISGGGIRIPCMRVADGPDMKERMLILDCSNKKFSRKWTENFIKRASLHRYSAVAIKLSNSDVLRMDSEKAPELTAAIRSFSPAQMSHIIKTAEVYHVDLIPAFDISEGAVVTREDGLLEEFADYFKEAGAKKMMLCSGKFEKTDFKEIEDRGLEVILYDDAALSERVKTGVTAKDTGAEKSSDSEIIPNDEEGAAVVVRSGDEERAKQLRDAGFKVYNSPEKLCTYDAGARSKETIMAEKYKFVNPNYIFERWNPESASSVGSAASAAEKPDSREAAEGACLEIVCDDPEYKIAADIWDETEPLVRAFGSVMWNKEVRTDESGSGKMMRFIDLDRFSDGIVLNFNN